MRKKGSSNRYKAVKKLRRAYQKLADRKRDAANKIVHNLLEHEHVYMQDENLKVWHKGLSGRTVQHSVLGLVKAKLIMHERVTVLPANTPTTKYCPVCGKLKKDITLADRVHECSCGYSEDRDIHAARNMILLNKANPVGRRELLTPPLERTQDDMNRKICAAIRKPLFLCWRATSSSVGSSYSLAAIQYPQ